MINTIEQYAARGLAEAQFKWDRAANWRDLSAVQVLKIGTNEPTAKVAILLEGMVAVKVIELPGVGMASATAIALNALFLARWDVRAPIYEGVMA
ncbi:hypothetical protein KE423_003914 [Salmonella enterica]|nr:hypothetical protein [Salmonella enterica]